MRATIEIESRGPVLPDDFSKWVQELCGALYHPYSPGYPSIWASKITFHDDDEDAPEGNKGYGLD
jgi:hypothetical protein